MQEKTTTIKITLEIFTGRKEVVSCKISRDAKPDILDFQFIKIWNPTIIYESQYYNDETHKQTAP